MQAHDADAALREVLERAVAEERTPGLVAVVGTDIATPRPGETGEWPQRPRFRRFVCATGQTSPWEFGRPVSSRTPYDLASLTKALSTTLICAHALASGRVTLDETPWAQWPRVSIRHVLQHRAGLPAWRAFFEEVDGAGIAGTLAGSEAVVRACLAEPLAYAPGERTCYSDLGFIALGALLEERCGARLDRLFHPLARRIFGKTGLCFVPTAERGYHRRHPDVAPTETCPWRGRTLQGQVHDDNAFAMGGVAGHAGLFGSADDVAAASAALVRLLGRALARQPRDELEGWMAVLLGAPGDRALGFDRASPEGTTGGALRAGTIGHLGFTGTSMWLEPAGPSGGASYYVLLSNRIHPSRSREGIRDLRVDFHRAARAWTDSMAAVALKRRR